VLSDCCISFLYTASTYDVANCDTEIEWPEIAVRKGRLTLEWPEVVLMPKVERRSGVLGKKAVNFLSTC